MFERLKGVLGHSAFWLAACSIILNLAPYVSTELAGYPETMRWIRIATAAAWVIYLYLGGKLPEPAPPGLLQRPEESRKLCSSKPCKGRDEHGRFTK